MEEGFWDQDWVVAAITFVIAFVIAFVVDRLVIGRATRVAARVGDATTVSVSRSAQTRLRLIRRLVFVTIIVIGALLALSEFSKFDRLANAVLASSAVLGIVLGFAAQKVLANPLAGILLAISQPIRIGDLVTIGDETGRVEDLTLSHTFVDTGDGRQVIVPNETVVTSVVVNRSTGDLTAPAMVSLWVPAGRGPGPRPRGARAARALADRGRRDHRGRSSDRGPRAAAPGGHPGGRRGGRAARARAPSAARGGHLRGRRPAEARP